MTLAAIVIRLFGAALIGCLIGINRARTIDTLVSELLNWFHLVPLRLFAVVRNQIEGTVAVAHPRARATNDYRCDRPPV